MKRFYKQADVAALDGGWTITLDGRTVKTPAKALLKVPSQPLANAIAGEWQTQTTEIDPRTMPMMRTACTVIDGVIAKYDEVLAATLAYGGSDLLCYRAENPERLVIQQAKAWQPLLDWAKHSLAVNLQIGPGIVPVTQEPAALAQLEQHLKKLNAWELTGVHLLVGLSGSLILGLAVYHGRIDGHQIFELSQLDETYQQDNWGLDEEAQIRRANIRQDLSDAAKFLGLLSVSDEK